MKNIQREKQRAGGTPALRNGSSRESELRSLSRRCELRLAAATAATASPLMIRRRRDRHRRDLLRHRRAAAGAAILLIELVAASAGIRVVVELIAEIGVARVAGLALAIARFGRLLRLVQVAAAASVVGVVAA